MTPNDDPAKYVGDGISIVTLGATFAGWLPTIAAFLSIVWVIIRIYESNTVQCMIHGRKCGG